MTDVFLARQPILDRDQSVDGYELLYPHGEGEHSPNGHDALQAARVALNALSEIGLEHLVGPSRAWISVSREFLAGDLVHNLPADRTVLELPAKTPVDQQLLDALADLRRSGYQVALHQFRYAPDLVPL